MSQTSKTNALVIAEELKEWAKDYAPTELALSLSTAAHCLIESQHTRIEEMRAELSNESARTAEEKLRAAQMAEQHRMQSNIRADVEAERDRFRAAYNEWHDKTEWVQKTSKGKELGKHRADVLRERIADLEAQLSAIGAGGVESLSKIGPARGQAGFEAWWRDKYPSFAMHAPDVWEAAMHHAAQPARECLQQSAEEVDFLLEDLPPVEGLDVILAEYEKTYGRTPDAAMAATVGKVKNMLLMWWASHREAIAAALQAAPPAPAGVAVPDADDAARFKAQHDFLKWNRAQQDPLVKVAGEYGVFNKAVDLYRAALAAGPASASDTESVLIDGIAYEVHAAVAGELLSLHLDLLAAAPAQTAQPVARIDSRVRPDGSLWRAEVTLTQPLAQFSDLYVAPAQEHATQLAGQGQAAPWKDHHTACLISDLRACATQYHGAGQLRERIAYIVAPLCDRLKAAPAAPAVDAREDARDVRIAKLTTAYSELSKIFHDQVVAQQAAWIEWQHGAGAEAGMQWIENGLCGPGHIPDEDGPYGKEAQAWFDANQSDPFPVCHCGRPSNILWMGQGFCSKAHHDADRAAQGGAA